ncbi:MAG TPA: alpha/beta hydrolase family protein [Candidatus Paceibacterota bacterium]|nr:alpha/beta hydrolase family protein [Verrucomicrobiota bacterium]HSA11551.1 alpha/beta hydrolase family protein [Candidatus Paceibacterota bacterium]
MAQTNQTDAARWLAKSEVAPRFTVPASRTAWEKKRRQVRARLWELLGKLPPRPKLPKVETLSRKTRGDCVVEKLQFDNGAGATVPGYLLRPKGLSRRAPAVLYCHWHGGEYDIGKEELFQARHTPEAPGPTLVKRGFVVLAIDAYCFGERNGRGPGGTAETGREGEMTASKFNLWVGRTLWGMMLRDDLMALDYLASRPEVDARRMGVTGISMGATRSWWLMALDERIRAGVAVACLTRYQNLIEREALQAHGIYYFVPRLLNHFDTEAVVALIAPRPALFMNGDQDDGSPPDGIHSIEAVARPAYRLYGRESDFLSVIYPGQGHVYTPEMWCRTLDWLDAKLKSGKPQPSATGTRPRPVGPSGARR